MEDVIKPLVLANAAQQQANATQRDMLNALQKQTQVLHTHTQQQISAVQEQTQMLFEKLAVAAEGDRKTLTEVVQTLAQRSPLQAADSSDNSSPIHVSRFLSKMTAEDDPEAFLLTFERTAEREAWPKTRWAGLLAPLLTGESQKAYYDLESVDAMDYDKVKLEILARRGVTLAVRAQHVKNWSYQAGKSPRSQMFDLIHLVRKWLQPESLSGPQIIERVVMDRFLRSLPIVLKKWVTQGDPKSVDQLVEIVERYFAAEDLNASPVSPWTFRPKPRPPSAIGKTVPGNVGGERGKEAEGKTADLNRGGWHSKAGTPVPVSRPNLRNVRCFRCQELGHLAANCPLTDEPMQCDLSFKERRQSLFSTVSCTAVPVKGKHMCAITVNDKHVTALLDTGSLVTLIKAELIGSVNFRAKKVAVVCVHGDTREYPIVAVKFGTARGDLRHLVGVVPHLVHDVIIGRDFPEFWELWEHPDCATVSKPETESEYMDAAEQLYSEDPSWGSPDFPFSVLAGELEESEGPIAVGYNLCT
uniref:CCHC-type domain-containing protein n=1 Tax=Leptobrachium leishanense TaxID=445787 RepID=A0A8C5LSP2_9ANUR